MYQKLLHNMCIIYELSVGKIYAAYEVS